MLNSAKTSLLKWHGPLAYIVAITLWELLRSDQNDQKELELVQVSVISLDCKKTKPVPALEFGADVDTFGFEFFSLHTNFTTTNTMNFSAFLLLSLSSSTLVTMCESFTVLQQGTWVNYMSGENCERPPISPDSFYPAVYNELDVVQGNNHALFLSQAYKNMQRQYGYGLPYNTPPHSHQERTTAMERRPIRPDDF